MNTRRSLAVPSLSLKRVCAFCIMLILTAALTPRTDAGESFTVTTKLYQGFDLATGMTELDPTVITIVIGPDQEIETISAPSIEPLFEFSPPTDMFFGFNTDADLPVSIFAEHINGMTVIQDTAFDAITDDMLAQLGPLEDCPMVAIDSNDIVVLLTSDDEFILLGDVRLLPEMHRCSSATGLSNKATVVERARFPNRGRCYWLEPEWLDC